MTERRAHWTDELINAVKDALDDFYYNGPGDDDPYIVIAAVEDRLADCDLLHEVVQQGAKIQAVRDWADVRITTPSLSDYSDGFVAAADTVLEILDGPDE